AQAVPTPRAAVAVLHAAVADVRFAPRVSLFADRASQVLIRRPTNATRSAYGAANNRPVDPPLRQSFVPVPVGLAHSAATVHANDRDVVRCARDPPAWSLLPGYVAAWPRLVARFCERSRPCAPRRPLRRFAIVR